MHETGPGIVIFVILAVNTVFAVVYLIWNLIVIGAQKRKAAQQTRPDDEENPDKTNENKNEAKRSCWTKFFVMLICPIVGPLFFICSYIWYKLFFSAPVNLEDVVFSKEKVKFNVRADEESERNMIPLEEAIEITDKQDLRRLMMSVVSGDIKKFLAAISLALDSEDSETSHYAASVLQDELNSFRVKVDKLYDKMQKNDENRLIYAETLIEYMIPFLSQKVFLTMEKLTYVNILDEACELLYKGEKSRMTAEYMEFAACQLLDIYATKRCEIWCDRSMKDFPQTLSSYTSKLKLLFKLERREEFFELLNELKQTSIVIDKETLEIIRIFNESSR